MPGHLRGQTPWQTRVPPTCTPHLRAQLAAATKARGGQQGGSQPGGAGPDRLPLPPANPRRPDWPLLPWPAPSARPVSPRAARTQARCCQTGYPFSGNPLPTMAAMAGDCARARASDQSIPQAATGVAAERIKTVMSTDDRKWVTRKDAAALARCSQDSIVRTEKKHKLQTRTNDAKATLLNTDDLIRVGLTA
jgi:hypothetical protein